MKRTMTQKIICLAVAALFLINDISFGLGVMPGSTQAETKESMYALGQKLFAAKIGPGFKSIDDYDSSTFVGSSPEIPGVKFVDADYANPPQGWKNNQILQKTDLIEALRSFRDNANIAADFLDIKEGYFDTDEDKGELPIARIEPVKKNGEIKYILIVHTKFVQMWNHIRQNDVWFEADIPGGNRRTISVAWGIFYRLARHEMAQLYKTGDGRFKSLGHIVPGSNLPQRHEDLANESYGNYGRFNDAIWMWFLGSYAIPSNSTKYNNDIFRVRIEWFFSNSSKDTKDLREEFPMLIMAEDLRKYAYELAAAINYNFFSRQNISAPEVTVDPKHIAEFERREDAREAAGIAEAPLAATQKSSQRNAEAKVRVLFADDPASPEALDLIREELRRNFGTDVEIAADHGNGKDEEWLRKQIETYRPHVIVVRSETKAFKNSDSPLLKLAKESGVKAIIRAGAGTDNIAAKKAEELGIPVARTHGNANSVADLTMFMLASLADTKNVQRQKGKDLNINEIVQTSPDEYLALVRKSKKWNGFSEEQKEDMISRLKRDLFDPLVDNESASLIRALEGQTIGLLGFGPIAETVARKLKLVKDLTGISFNVIAYSRSLKDDSALAKELGVTPVSREKLLRESDILSIHLPGDIPGLALTASELNSGKLRAVINTARSDLADPGDIQRFIEERGGRYIADLDITNDLQSLMENNPDNVFVLPHIGASTKDAEKGVAERTVSALVETSNLLLGRENVSPELDVVNGVKVEPIVIPSVVSKMKGGMRGLVPTNEVDQRSLVNIIDEYTVNTGAHTGPGFVRLDAKELERVYKTVELFHNGQVEIILPKSIGISDTMKRTLNNANNRHRREAGEKGEGEERDIITCRIYSNEDNLRKILETSPAPGIKRIVITDKASGDDEGRERFLKLVSDNDSLFKDTRLLNILLSEDYASLKEGDKTFHQARIIMIAILARILEKDSDMTRMMLKTMLDGYVADGSVDEFIENLAKDDSSWSVVEKIQYFLGKTVSLIPQLVKELDLLKLRMKTFWVAA